MARKPRVEFEGAFYHVIVRGNQRRDIFRDDRDRATYLERLEHYRKKYGFKIYAYVLMSNHVHLLIETQKTPLSKVMQGIQFSYTQYYNRCHKTVGHLFQGRYKAILCDQDSYLLELVRYLHLNPARLHRPKDPWKYRWSSQRAYLGEKSPVEVDTKLVLGRFGRALGQARRAYRKFVEEGIGQGHEDRYYEVVDQRFLGDENFLEKVHKQARGGEVEVKGPKVPFGRLLEAVAKEHRVTTGDLTGPGRQRRWVRARAMLVYLAREWSEVTCKELAGRLHRDPSLMSRLYAMYHLDRDRLAEARVARLARKQISP
jgi:REP element-mobilizing transposase RayT